MTPPKEMESAERHLRKLQGMWKTEAHLEIKSRDLTVARMALEACAKIAEEVSLRKKDQYYEDVPWQTVAVNIAIAIRSVSPESILKVKA